MSESKHIAGKVTLGDAAVDGLLAGGGAGLLMAGYLLGAGFLEGGDWLAALGNALAAETSLLAGGLTHLSLAAIYGALFGTAVALLPRRRPFLSLRAATAAPWLGLAFGLILLLLARTVLPSVATSLLTIAPVHFAIAHVVYGLALGWLLSRGDLFSLTG